MRSVGLKLVIALCLLSGLFPLGANAESFVVPFSGNLYLQAAGGDGGADTRFGIGTSPANFVAYLTGLPDNPSSRSELLVGAFQAGQTVHFGMYTVWGGQGHWAFSSGTDLPSVVAFTDRDNSLRMGGRVIEQTSANTWLMHLDNAASHLVDDDDNDLLIRIRLDGPQSLPPATVAFWRFENNFLDSSGNGLHGTAVGAPTFQAVSVPGSATGLRCDGVKDRVFVTDSPILALAHSITVEAFVGRVGGTGQLVFRGDDRVAKDPYSLALDGGRVLFRIDDESRTSQLISPSPLPATQMVHVAGTLDGSTGFQKLFVNGQEVASTRTDVRPLVALDPSAKPGVGICNVQSDTYAQYFQGVIDEVRISNAALQPSQFLNAVSLGPPLLSVGTNSVVFDFHIVGNAPAPQTVSVLSTSTPVPFSVTLSGGPWLSASPLSGTTPAVLNVSVNPVGLAPGSYSGTLRIDAPTTNSPQTVALTLTVRETAITWAPSGLTFTHDAGAPGPPPQVLSIASTGPSLAFTCSTSGGAWLAANPSQGTTPSTLSVSVNPAPLLVGTYNGSIIIVASAASNAVQSIPVTLIVRPRTPKFAAAGIVNAASYAAGLVPGGLVSIFGTGLSGVVGTEWAAGASSHKGVSVSIGGNPAPLIALISRNRSAPHRKSWTNPE